MRRADTVRAVLVLAVAIPLGIGGEWAFSRTGASLAELLRDLAVGWAFVAAGLVAWHRQRDSRTGTLMVAEGLSWFITNFQGSGIAPLFILGTWLGALNEAILIHLVLAFPDGRLSTRIERGLVSAAYAIALVGGAAFIAVNGTPYDPYRCPGCTAGLPPAPGGPMLAVIASHAGDGLGVLLGVLFVAVIIRRWARSSPAGRRAQAPVWLALGTCLLLIAEHAWEASPIQPPAAAVVVIWAADILELAVPFGFLALVLRMRIMRAAVGEVVLGLGPDVSLAALGPELRRTLSDPALELGVWHDPPGAYLDAADRVVRLPAADDAARSWTLVERDGRPAAAIVHDRALAGDRHLLGAVVSAVRLAMEREELQASGARIAARADTERRRLERDLHDGAQQRFVLLALTLGSALQQIGQRPDEAGLHAMLARAADELRTGLGELRELARGIHPAVLTERGLAAAAESLAARLPVASDVTVTGGPWPPDVEATAYFVISEALANVIRHAEATRVRVTVCGAGGLLVLDVADDGVGGADPDRGSGLRGLRDRLAAAGGALSVDSPAGAGTRLHAVLPCA